ncbi:nitroreductase/quinone reductase family protein [Lentzea fradiae]|uniref:nitroreductase/quinone reductase family protein n=1 Tax=Lentzea fradiae TaxID=200378 RepID=UPI001FE09421|nr:nitroreductase/quinone reductase family protein [Lentzea fradiae]
MTGVAGEGLEVVDDGWAVFGTHGGSPRHPVWFHNLMANPHVTVEVVVPERG